jgi:hypothetical protein
MTRICVRVNATAAAAAPRPGGPAGGPARAPGRGRRPVRIKPEALRSESLALHWHRGSSQPGAPGPPPGRGSDSDARAGFGHQ